MIPYLKNEQHENMKMKAISGVDQVPCRGESVDDVPHQGLYLNLIGYCMYFLPGVISPDEIIGQILSSMIPG